VIEHPRDHVDREVQPQAFDQHLFARRGGHRDNVPVALAAHKTVARLCALRNEGLDPPSREAVLDRATVQRDQQVHGSQAQIGRRGGSVGKQGKRRLRRERPTPITDAAGVGRVADRVRF
jgi:hypothetical protein